MVDTRYWYSTVKHEVRRKGVLRGGVTVGKQLWGGGLERLEPLGPTGQLIYNEDWDVLLILDACRLDQLREISPEYSFLTDVGSFNSLAGYSREWLTRNFTGKNHSRFASEIGDTAYITGNPFTNEVFSDSNPFGYMDEVWRYGWDDDDGTIHPVVLTDRAIQVWREGNHDRMIVHYMQPHIPFVGDPNADWHRGFDPRSRTWGTDEQPKDLWACYRDGELSVSKEQLWAAYQQNLRYVLDNIGDVLLSNMDAESVVISADHGNGIGDRGYYGHGNVPLKAVKTVPWVETTAHDSEEYSPERTPDHDSTDDDVKRRLQVLGYHG